MILIVDGYNILKQQASGRFIEDSVRAALVRKLQAYCKRKRHRIVLVFDGGQVPWPHKESHECVEVVYAGAGKSADDYVRSFVAENANREIMLVSTDRALARAVAHFQVPTIDSADFVALMTHALNKQTRVQGRRSALVKTTADSSPELDELMQEASKRAMYKEDDGQISEDRLPARTAESKQSRLLQKKLAKL